MEVLTNCVKLKMNNAKFLMAIRNLISAIALLVCTISGHAQDFSWGPEIGFTHSSIDEAFESEKQFSKNGGFHFGLFGRVTFSGFLIQTEALFHRTNREIQIKNIDENAPSINGNTVNLDYAKFNIPILFGKKFLEFLRFNVGPFVSFHLNDKIDVSDGDDIQASYKEASLGGQAGMGLDFWQIVINFKYQFGFSRLIDNLEVEGQHLDSDVKENFFLLELGWRFGIDD